MATPATPATQVEIAQRVGLDVSSVNKILNKVRGVMFRMETVKLVWKTAREMGYDFDRASKGKFRGILEELFPERVGTPSLVVLRGVSHKEVIQIKKLLYGKPEPSEKEFKL